MLVQRRGRVPVSQARKQALGQKTEKHRHMSDKKLAEQTGHTSDVVRCIQAQKVVRSSEKAVGQNGDAAPLRKWQLEQSFSIPAPCEKAEKGNQ